MKLQYPPPPSNYKYLKLIPDHQMVSHFDSIEQSTPLFFKKTIMEFSSFHPSSWLSYFTSPLLSPYHFIPENYVHWTETPESHVYSADLPGVKKEEIRVEVEDSGYLIIRTEAAANESTEPAKNFMRKFRLPESIDINGISARYENGVLTVDVPRSFMRRGFFIEAADMPEQSNMHVLARAA